MKQGDVVPNMGVSTSVDPDAPEMLIDLHVRRHRKSTTGRVWKSHMTQGGLWYVIHTDNTVAPYWHTELEPCAIDREVLFPIG
jgi:hypothetical protein